MQSQIWNLKHRKTNVSNVDIGFNQSEAQISLHSRVVFHNKANIKCSPSSTKRKALGTRVIKFLIPLYIRRVIVINRFPFAPLGKHIMCSIDNIFSERY